MKTKKIALVIAVIIALSMVFAGCDQSGSLGGKEDGQIQADESTYEVVETTEEYAGVTYKIPTVEGMINKSKQADANGHLKRLTMAATRDKSGVRGPISENYDIMIANNKILSARFITTLDYDMETRAFTMLVESNKILFTIENLFGKAETNPDFAEMRAVFEEAGADSSIEDEDFRKKNIYFEGDDMTDLILHVTYFTDVGHDIEVSFNDVYPYLLDDVAELFEFAR